MKTKLLFLFLILNAAFLISHAQAPSWAWAKSAGAADFDWAHSITTDSFGNVYVTGSFRSTTIGFGTTTLISASAGWGDIFIVKYDASGNVLWAKSAGGTSADLANGIATDNSGNVYVIGFFDSPTITFGATTLTRVGSNDVFIAKYNSFGNVLWAKSAGGTNSDEGWSITSDVSGNVYVTGGFNSPTLTFGATTLTRVGGDDIFIAKYDALGNVLWAKSAGGTNIDTGWSISTDGLGNVYVTGSFLSPTLGFGADTLINTSANTDDIFIAKYDASGNILWVKSAGGNVNDSGYSITTDGLGNVYVTGMFESDTITFGATSLTNAGGNDRDIFIAKYDASGNVLWAKSAGGTYSELGFSIATDGSGNVYVAGWFDSPALSFGTSTLTNAGFSDIFIVKYDSLGNALWAKSAGGTNSDNGWGVTADGSGNVYVTGNYRSDTLSFGATKLTNASAGSDDIFTAKLGMTVGINEWSNEGSFEVFPNPTSGAFNVQMSEYANVQMKIYNIYGECIHQHIRISANQQIDLSSHPSGVYFLQLKTEVGIASKKLIIQK